MHPQGFKMSSIPSPKADARIESDGNVSQASPVSARRGINSSASPLTRIVVYKISNSTFN